MIFSLALFFLAVALLAAAAYMPRRTEATTFFGLTFPRRRVAAAGASSNARGEVLHDSVPTPERIRTARPVRAPWKRGARNGAAHDGDAELRRWWGGGDPSDAVTATIVERPAEPADSVVDDEEPVHNVEGNAGDRADAQPATTAKSTEGSDVLPHDEAPVLDGDPSPHWVGLVDPSRTSSTRDERLDMVESLGLLQEPWCATILDDVLASEPDREVRYASLRAIARARYETSLQAIIDHSALSDDAHERLLAVAALAALGASSALLIALTDPDDDVAAAAANAVCAHMSIGEAAEFLQLHVDDRDRCESLLATLGAA